MNLKHSFLQEADELLDSIHTYILKLEEVPDDEENVNHIYRAAHTLKGSANLYGYGGIAVLTHLLETLLDDLRDKKRLPAASITDLLLESFDQLQSLYQAIAEGSEDPQSDPELLLRLSQFASAEPERGEKREAPRLFSDQPEDWQALILDFMHGRKPAEQFADYFFVPSYPGDKSKKLDRSAVKLLRDIESAARQLAAVQRMDEQGLQAVQSLRKQVAGLRLKQAHSTLDVARFQLAAILTMLEQYVSSRPLPSLDLSWWGDVWTSLEKEADAFVRTSGQSSFYDMTLDIWELCKPAKDCEPQFGTLLAPHFDEPDRDAREAEPAGLLPPARHQPQLQEPPAASGQQEPLATPEDVQMKDTGAAKRLVIEQIYFLAPKGRPLPERWELARRILHNCAKMLEDAPLEKLAASSMPDMLLLKEKAKEYSESDHSLQAQTASAAESGAPGASPAPAGSKLPVSVPETADFDRVVRVEQQKIDRLMELIGELAVAKNAFPYMIRHIHEKSDFGQVVTELKEKYAALDRISKELQDAIVEIRMLPVSSVFAKFNRFVRDMARQSGKQVKLEIAGDDTRLDKTLVEALSDPLIHLVRNAIDHGIETAEERRAEGKPPDGSLKLNAGREGNRVVIEVMDDGRGIDAARIRRKLLEKGAISAEKAEGLTYEESIPFIFQPGLSTAEEVTSLSGRGVGMDAVRSSVLRLRGHVDVSSEPGRGTSVRLELPLTLSMVAVLQVKVGGHMYGIPLEHIEESVKASPGEVRTIQGRPVLVLRNQVYPVLHLGGYFAGSTAAVGFDRHADHYMVLLNNGICLKVDALIGQQDVMIKPVDGCFRHLPYLSGASILGDGTVMLIMNVNGIKLEETAAVLQ